MYLFNNNKTIRYNVRAQRTKLLRRAVLYV